MRTTRSSESLFLSSGFESVFGLTFFIHQSCRLFTLYFGTSLLASSSFRSKIFNQLERTDNGYVALNLIIMKIVATFSDIDEPTILKQLSAAGIPRSHKALDLEGFQKFMAVNLSSHPCVSLDQWLGVLYGYEVVLGSVVRKGNANVQEVREEIEDYSKKKRTTKLTKLLGAIGIGRGGVEESGAVGDDS